MADLPAWTRHLWADPIRCEGAVCVKDHRVTATRINLSVHGEASDVDETDALSFVAFAFELEPNAVLACVLWEGLERRKRERWARLLTERTVAEREANTP